MSISAHSYFPRGFWIAFWKKKVVEENLVDQTGCQTQNRGGCGLDDFKVNGFTQVWGVEFCLQTPISSMVCKEFLFFICWNWGLRIIKALG